MKGIRFGVMVMGGFLLASCATVPRARDEGGAPWFRAAGEHVVVQTDLGVDEAVDLVRVLENWRQAMTAALFSRARAPRQVLTVVVLRNRELEAMAPLVRGLYRDDPYVGPYLVLGASETSQRNGVMKHEMAHAVVHENLQEPPRWLDEGLAVYLETTDLDERTGHVEWGRIRGEWTVPSDYRGSDELFGPWPRDQVGALEYSAGRMVHMLARQHPDELECLLRALADGELYAHAVERCAPDRKRWGWEYSHEFYESSGALGRAQIPAQAAATLPEAMPDADVHALLAFLDRAAVSLVEPARRHAREMSARRHRDRALALDPANVLGASLKLTSRDSDCDPKGELTARLIRAHDGDWRAWLWRADLISTPETEKKAALGRAVALAPDRPEVLELQAYQAMAERDYPAAARFARRELAASRWHSNGRILLFTALEHQGRCDELRAFLASDPRIDREVMQHLAKYAATLQRPIHCVDP